MRAIARSKTGLFLVTLGQDVNVAVNLSTGKWATVNADSLLASPDWGPVDSASREKAAAGIRKAVDNQAGRTALHHLVAEAKTISLASMDYSEKQERVSKALQSKLGIPSHGMAYPGSMDLWVRGLNDDSVVYCWSGKNYRYKYAMEEDGTVKFAGQPKEVTQAWVDLCSDRGMSFAIKAMPDPVFDLVLDLLNLGNPNRGAGGRFGSEGDSDGGSSASDRAEAQRDHFDDHDRDDRKLAAKRAQEARGYTVKDGARTEVPFDKQVAAYNSLKVAGNTRVPGDMAASRAGSVALEAGGAVNKIAEKVGMKDEKAAIDILNKSDLLFKIMDDPKASDDDVEGAAYAHVSQALKTAERVGVTIRGTAQDVIDKGKAAHKKELGIRAARKR